MDSLTISSAPRSFGNDNQIININHNDSWGSKSSSSQHSNEACWSYSSDQHVGPWTHICPPTGVNAYTKGSHIAPSSKLTVSASLKHRLSTFIAPFFFRSCYLLLTMRKKANHLCICYLFRSPGYNSLPCWLF